MPNVPAPVGASSSDVSDVVAAEALDEALGLGVDYARSVIDAVRNGEDLPPQPAADLITADRHPLDDVLEQALDDWQGSPTDHRTEGAVIRAVLADPQHRWLVTAWLQEIGLWGGES